MNPTSTVRSSQHSASTDRRHTGPSAAPAAPPPMKNPFEDRPQAPDEASARRAAEPGEPGSDLLKIGDFARLANTNLRTLRYYEELGLLEPAARSSGGFRYYRPTDLNRLRTIRDLQELGLALERIGELLATREEADTREQWLTRVTGALEEQERLVSLRIRELEARRESLSVARDRLKLCAQCTHRPGPQNNFCEPCVNTGEPLPPAISALF